MAEFLNKQADPPLDGFNAMGKPVPMFRKQAAYDHCKEMGVAAGLSWDCVAKMSMALERGKPYEAMEHGMKYLDLTGTYRIMAVLLTEKEQANG